MRFFSKLPVLLMSVGLLVAPNSHAEKVALTFDDLPLNGQLPAGVSEADIAKRTLAVLKARRAPPVFGFVNAQKLVDRPQGRDALTLWVKSGQRLGSHTYSHIDLHKSSAAEFGAEVDANEPDLQSLAKNQNWHWFRYPFLREGDTVEKRREVRGYLEKRGYITAQVTLDYEDYLWNTPYARCVPLKDRKAIEWLKESYLKIAADYLDHDRQLAELVFGRKIDHVLLLHLGAFSDTILPPLLDLLAKKGFVLATLEDVTGDPIYKTDPDAGSRYGGTLLEQWMDAKKIAYPKVDKKPVKELEALCGGRDSVREQ